MSSTTNPKTTNQRSDDVTASLRRLAEGQRSATDVAALSDLDRTTLREVAPLWSEMPLAQRRFVVRQMAELAESNVELNFHRVLRLAVSDVDAEVRSTAIAGLWEDESLDLARELVTLLAREDESAVREAAVVALGRFCLMAALDDVRDTALVRDIRSALLAVLRGDEPIGARSLQTLNDANLLKLELRYGVPMSVPLIGRIAVWAMRIVDGCAAPSAQRLGAVDLGVPGQSAAPREWTCPIYLAPDAAGNSVPRWPVRTSVTIRMQSPARRSAMTPTRTQSPVLRGAADRGAASVGPQAPASVASGAAPGTDSAVAVTANDDGSRNRSDSGWLGIGGERVFSVPGACT